MKKLLLSLSFGALLIGCTATQQTTAYQSISTVYLSAKTAYDIYIESVITGKSSTNGVPAVSAAYNKVQAGVVFAASISENSTNALAPASLLTDFSAFTNVIQTWK
jgi:uncharacterized protein YcfL